MQLTVKQRAFSKLVAEGTPKAKAYELVYGSRGGKARGRAVQSSILATKPAVAEAIEVFQDAIQPIADMRRCREEMLSNMRWLAKESPDHRVRLAATKMLHDIADERVQREAAVSKSQSVAV